MPFCAAPKSSTAIFAATTEPGPVMSEYSPDMSLRTPILVTSSAVWAYAVPQASAPATAAMLKRRFILSAPCLVLTLYAEIFVERSELGVQLGIGELVHDLSVLHDVIAVRDGRGEVKILLDQENGEALRLERADGLADLLDDDRRETLGRLVEQQEPRPGAQDAGDRQHLLLAAGELGALAAQALLEVGKQAEDRLEGKPARLDLRRQQQVLLDVEAGEDAAFLRAERDPGAGDMVRGAADELAVLEPHRALTLADDAHDGFERGGLAGAVAAQQRHHFAREHLERRPVQDVGFAVPGLQCVDREQRRRGLAVKHGRPPCRPRAPRGWPRPSRNRLRRGCGRG